MTLVPIIYTSLLIFSAILLFVLLVSYISYKTKARGKVSRSAEQIPIRRLVLAGNTLQIHNRAGKTVAGQMQSARRRQCMPPAAAKKHFTQNVENRRTERHNLNTREDFVRSNQSDKNYNTNKSYTVNKGNKATQFVEQQRRLEIMNQNEKFRTMVERRSYNEDLPKHGPNLAEMNLLNYYSDNNEFEMVTLSASRSKAN